MQNPTLTPEALAHLANLNQINVEAWEHTAAYWKREYDNAVEELKRPETDWSRTQYLRGFIASVEGIINFPALVEAERESLLSPE